MQQLDTGKAVLREPEVRVNENANESEGVIKQKQKS